MARIRSLKPEFWDDRKLARSTSRDARMLYMGLWNQADEHSRLNGDEVWIKGRVFPYEDDINEPEIKAMLGELEDAGRIVRYSHDGDPFIYLLKLSKHQRLEPAKVESRLPEPPALPGPRTSPDTDAESSAPRADQSAPDADSSTLLYVAGSMDQVAGSRGQGDARGARIPDEWSPNLELVQTMRDQGIPDDLARRELPKFRDYWTAQPGAKGRKADWPAVWRNWLRRAAENEPGTRPAESAADRAVRTGLDLAAQLRREERGLPA